MTNYRATYHIGFKTWMVYGQTPMGAAIKLIDFLYRRHVTPRIEGIHVKETAEELSSGWFEEEP